MTTPKATPEEPKKKNYFLWGCLIILVLMCLVVGCLVTVVGLSFSGIDPHRSGSRPSRGHQIDERAFSTRRIRVLPACTRRHWAIQARRERRTGNRCDWDGSELAHGHQAHVHGRGPQPTMPGFRKIGSSVIRELGCHVSNCCIVHIGVGTHLAPMHEARLVDAYSSSAAPRWAMSCSLLAGSAVACSRSARRSMKTA